MRGLGAALAVVLLAASKVDDAHAFAPLRLLNRATSSTIATGGQQLGLPVASGHGFVKINARVQATTTSYSPDQSVAALFDEDVVRQTYDEWRSKYNRGDFDSARYENFKNNYNILTAANLEARHIAEQENRPMPKWMTLNEFGDFSEDEYKNGRQETAEPASSTRKTIQIDETPPVEAATEPEQESEEESETVEAKSDPLPISDNDTEESEVSTEKKGIQPLDSVRNPGLMDMQTNNDDADLDKNPSLTDVQTDNDDDDADLKECRQVYEGWCADYGKEPDTVKFATFSSNYLAMRDYARRTRTLLKLNKYADLSKEEYAQAVKEDEAAAPKTERPKPATTYGLPSDFGRPTLQISERQDAYGRPISSTSPVTSTSEPEPTPEPKRKTETIAQTETGTKSESESDSESEIDASSVPYRPTQKVNMLTDEPAVRGTQVVQKFDSVSGRGTQVIQKANAGRVPSKYIYSGPVRGTQVIQQAGAPGGTKVIQKADGRTQNPVRGTQVIKSQGQSQASSGTQVIRSASAPPTVRGTQVISSSGKTTGTQVIKSASATSPPTVRGTQVISSSKPTAGTQVIRSADSTRKKTLQIDDDLPQATDAPGRKTISIGKPQGEKPFDANQGNDPAPRGTIVIQRNPNNGNPIRGTVVIRKNEVGEEASPVDGLADSVLSLFGGQRKPKEEPLPIRGTIVIRKNPNPGFKMPSLSIFDDNNDVPQNVPVRKTLVINRDPKNDNSIFSFFGGAKKEAASSPVRQTIAIKKPQNYIEAALNFITGTPEVEVVEKEESPSDRAKRKRAERLDAAKARSQAAKDDRLEKEAQLEVERKKRLEEMEKERAARKTLVNAPIPKRNPSTYTMLGGFKKKPDELIGVATLTGWKQLGSGVIIGYVSGNPRYKTNTRITTSPVEKGVQRGDTIMTKSGTKYKLL